nr:autotransporter outer membrane beta-barrel domain-containing protein [Enterobacter sp. SA187]
MQRKSVLSICIALALSGNGYAETEHLAKDRTANLCPANMSVLTEEQKAQLAAECLQEPSFMEDPKNWVIGGMAAVVAAVGIAVENDHDGESSDNSDSGNDDGGDNGGDDNDGGDNGGDDNGDDNDNGDNGNDDNNDNGDDGDDGGDEPLVINGGTGTATDNVGEEIDVDGKIIIIKGDSTGTDSGIGTQVKGDKNTINNEGGITATTDGTGFAVTGNENTINNTGATSVTDGGTGTQISGNSNTLNQNGKMIVGDFSTGINVTGDSNNVNLISDELKITGYDATGVNITGNTNTVTLTGDMVVDKDQKSPLAKEYFFKPSTGINVAGNDNTVVLDGHMQVVLDTEMADSHKWAKYDGSQEPIFGLVVAGEGNRVDIMGGIELTGEINQTADNETGNKRNGPSSSKVISVSGNSSVYLHGESSINGDFGQPFKSIIGVSDGGYFEISEDATLETDITSINKYLLYNYNYLGYIDTNSTMVNKGAISINDIGFAQVANGSTFINEGEITLEKTMVSAGTDGAVVVGPTAMNKGSLVRNEGSITGYLLNRGSILPAGDIESGQMTNDDVGSIVLMTAQKGAQAINNGSLTLYGRGEALHAQDSTADNYGQITTDALWVAEGDDTTYAQGVPSDKAIDYAVGMGAGNTYTHGKNGTAINHEGGIITVNNAGAGMAAVGATNVVINQGTINLNQNENYTGDEPLVGMAVYEGGSAINDTTGVININAENGIAFYSDGDANNRIINRGEINVNESAGVPAAADNSDEFTSIEYADGTILSDTTTLDKSGVILTGSTVSNTGTLNGPGRLFVDGTLENQATGIVNAPLTVTGTVNNSGTITQSIAVNASGKVVSDGIITGGAILGDTAHITNSGAFSLGSASDKANASMLEMKKNSVFENAAGGVMTGDNIKNAVHMNDNSTVKNDKGATMNFTASSHAAAFNIWGGTADFINDGTVNGSGMTSVVRSADNAAASKAFFWNQDDGVVNFTASQTGQSAVSLTHSNYVGVNDGTMNVNGNDAVGMKGSNNAQLVNNGTINLGTAGTTESGMVAMQLDANATADAVIENNGAINIYASNSYAFSKLGANGRIVNNGTVNLEGSGSGLVKESGVEVAGVNGNTADKSEAHYASYTLPTDPTVAPQSTGLRSSINQYTVGTSADGSAGTLTASHVDIQDVNVDTGFTAGTADTSVTFNDVFVGEDIQGEQNITSASVVWTAEGEKDASGNVDVTMTKNAYADVAGDASVNSVANALDAAYTSNELYNSLNLATSAELTSALKQISGSKATGVSRDARILSNRFDMLADTAPVMNNGLAFNVVAKGDKRAELGNDTTYDMLALRQSLAFGDNQTLTMEYGIARLDGDGNAMSAGDNGVTGGYSQFLGLKHSLPLTEGGLNWDNALRYDVHNFDSNRAVRYGDVNKTANADTRQQYMEFRTEGSKAFKVQEGLTVTPFAGLKMRHTMEDGYSEKGAGDFNLSMSSSSETAVDAVVGLKLSYAGEDGWAATASLEGGPNLSYAKSNRTASLAGARGQTFSVDDAQQGGGVNGQAMAGVKYSAGNAQFTADAFQWQEDGVKDKGFMLNYKYKF